MGLSKEALGRSGKQNKETKNVFHSANSNSFYTEVNNLSLEETGLELRTTELPQILFIASKKVEETEGLQPQKSNKNGFEPFVNPQPPEDPLFVNEYNGNFTQRMGLNRKGVEKVLRISHLEGRVFLTSLSFSRQRYMDGLNPDGSVTAKKKLMLGEKTDDSQKEINPPYRTVPTKDGWRIEINDGKIMEDLNEKKLTGEKLQKTFIRKFNQLLNKSLFESIRKEKMTNVKDKYFRSKLFSLILNPGFGMVLWAPELSKLDPFGIASFTGAFFAVNAFMNHVRLPSKKRLESFENDKRDIDPKSDVDSSAYMSRKLDSFWEYLMPRLEIDKVARSWVFLSLKGRKLVRETE